MNQALYAHMNNKRKMKKKQKQRNIHISKKKRVTKLVPGHFLFSINSALETVLHSCVCVCVVCVCVC
jgi:hypothetical protein